MRNLIVAGAVALLFPASAEAGDCSTINIRNGGVIYTSQISMLFQHKAMECVDMAQLTIKPDPNICATSVVDEYTIFTKCSNHYDGDHLQIAVRGGKFSEGQFLPQVAYRYLGPVTFTRANGFPMDIPTIEMK